MARMSQLGSRGRVTVTDALQVHGQFGSRRALEVRGFARALHTQRSRLVVDLVLREGATGGELHPDGAETVVAHQPDIGAIGRSLRLPTGLRGTGAPPGRPPVLRPVPGRRVIP